MSRQGFRLSCCTVVYGTAWYRRWLVGLLRHDDVDRLERLFQVTGQAGDAMSMLGHVAVGVAIARFTTPAGSSSRLLGKRMLVLSAVALLPDVDFIIHAAAPSYAAFAHRGATHSLAFAIFAGTIVAGAIRLRAGRGAVAWGVVAAVLLASHGILDWLGDTDLGVALLWPLSSERYLAPLHLLPNPPFFPDLPSTYALSQLGLEFLVFLPLWLFAFVPRRQFKPGITSTSEARSTDAKSQ